SEATLSDDNRNAEIKLDDNTKGEYEAKVNTDTGDQKSNKVILAVAPSSTGETPGESGQVLVTPIGEWSRGFAILTGLLALLIVLVVVLYAASRLLEIDIPNEKVTLGDKEALNGTFGERIAGIVVIVAAALGGILIIAGAWFSGLEARGRLTLKPSEQPQVG